jgi:hypothetical protein
MVCYRAYQSQNIFIMAQQQIMPDGWDPRNPLHSVKQHKGTGIFLSLHMVKNPVPNNILTQAYLRFAYGVSKETFRRWMEDGATFEPRVPHNKEKI